MKKFILHYLILTSLGAFAQNTKKIDSMLRMYENFDDMNGCVLLSEKGKIIYEKGFGKAVFEWNLPITPNTRFEIASMSKPFTAVIILQLIEQGKLVYDGKISDYLPWYPAETGSKITLKHLLLHTSGLTDTRFIENFDVRQGMQLLSRKELVNVFCNEKLLFEPGEKWSYSNFGYNLLACIAEEVTGRKFHELLADRIFTPCGMKASSTTELATIQNQLARPYERNFGDIQLGHYHHSSSSPGSSNIITTTGDYHLFYQGLLSGKLLGPGSLKLFLSPQTTMSGETTGFNFWFDKVPLIKNDTLNIIRSAGTMYGWNSVAYHIPESERLLVIFFNVRNNRMFEIADNIISLWYGLPYEKPKDNYAHIFFKDELDKGIDYAIANYRKLIARKTATSKFRDFNRLGYFYLQKNQLDKALAVFKLNVELFPEDAGVYDSIGEAYMLKGDKSNAILNYEKSISLDPANENAREMLRKMQSGTDK